MCPLSADRVPFTVIVHVLLQLRLFENRIETAPPPSGGGESIILDSVDVMTIRNPRHAQTLKSLTAAKGVWLAICSVKSFGRLKTIAGIRLEV
jgi:hypothetical protein